MDRFLDRLKPGGSARGQDDVGSGFAQRLGSSGADPAARAGNKRKFAVERQVVGHGIGP